MQHNQVTHLCVARHVLRALLNDLTEYVRATRKCISAAGVERPWDSDLGILKQILEFSASFSFQTCVPFYSFVVDADPNAAEICSNVCQEVRLGLSTFAEGSAGLQRGKRAL